MVAKTDLPNRAAFDVNITQDLRNQFRTDSKAGLKAAAQQFEAMFMQMMLKGMRDTVQSGGLLDSEQTKFYTGMFDQQLAQNLSSKGSLGLAKMIEKQLAAQLGSTPAAGAAGNANSDSGELGALLAAGDSKATALLAAQQVLNTRASNAAAPLPLEEVLGQLRSHMSNRATKNALDALPGVAAAQRGTQAVTLEGQKMNLTESSTPPASPREFVNRVWPYAVEASKTTGIPPQFLVAHAALESNWGKSEPRRSDGSPSHNLFGIKAGKSWQGDAVTASTTEFTQGQAQRVREPFRAYGSYADSFRDYASLLRNNPRYGNVIGSQDGTEFARRLQQAGYATDPQYASKLASIINGPTLRQALIG